MILQLRCRSGVATLIGKVYAVYLSLELANCYCFYIASDETIRSPVSIARID